jgi:hypothetical protein
MQLRRYTLPKGGEVQGLWYRNIGLWAVVAIVTGPEARRSEIEQAGKAVMTDMKWPSAPLNADLRAIAPEFLRTVRPCGEVDRGGMGKPAPASAENTMEIGIGLTRQFFSPDPKQPHPVLQSDRYCRLESFTAGGKEMTALLWRGDESAYWTARYAFMTVGSGDFYQFESVFEAGAQAVPATPPATSKLRRAVYLTTSDDRRVIVVQAFDDWPSYADAKELVLRAAGTQMPALVRIEGPPGKIDLVVSENLLPKKAAPGAR